MLVNKIKTRIMRHLGMTTTLWNHRQNGVYCFNFHRIGDATQCKYDPHVFSCTADDFKKHLAFIQNNFEIIDQTRFIELIVSNRVVDKKLAYITFDDGYLDNYELAFPILTARNIPATFFVATALIESQVIPWWDEIAWHIKHCDLAELQLSFWSEPINLSKATSNRNIQQVLSKIKAEPAHIDAQLKELRQLTGLELNDYRSEFMTWSQLREMESAGMTIGAHSHSHRIFSSLNAEDLSHELSHAKQLLEAQLSQKVQSISYPVGNASTYNKDMFDEIARQGYQLAFTFRYFINQELNTNKFQLGRFSISEPFEPVRFMELCLNAPTL
ncbi:Polysaccharide deacetylase [Colwellia chukchiensis]|uniref:Polysaccharide deacetylase n=1 Tax=Colwellia chukchiensis TaxID=641665 RepID=A0A1H7SCW7_9GAMM|nr:polysaccharide deacetylase family protein [Colwellia chukchiensis]SEL70460.1 Polysaccharide deacetylase [Colwellia chukchiensis]